MKRRVPFFLALCLVAALSFAQAPEGAKPQIIIFDVVTTSYDPGKAGLLTDVFRSEIFKTQLFSIVEKGVIQEAGLSGDLATGEAGDQAKLLQIGRAVKGDKLFICSIEKFSSTIVISVRIVDVHSALIDYTDNVFLSNEAQLFDAIKEIAAKIEFFYTAGKMNGDKSPEETLEERWRLLGAEGEDLAYLVSTRTDPDEYLTIRQYDITFTPPQYAGILRAKIDPGIIKNFLQAGVSYSQTERAIALGITKLDRYRDLFQKEGYSFEDYLEAYSKNIVSLEDYREYRKGYDKNFFTFGLGGVSDSFPIANATYRFFLGKASWESFWTPYQRGVVKISTDAGLYLMNLFAPVPFFQANCYVGSYPYYFKIGVGGHAEVILGGHVGAFLNFGIEFLQSLDFSVMIVPFGTQPAVSYTDFTSRPGESGYTKIVFPYAGVMVSYKIPVHF